MACISKLASAIAYNCDTGAIGLNSAIIINKADIAKFSVDGGNMVVSGLTLASGAKAYKIDTVKRSLVLSTALKVNDGAPNANTHSASIVLTDTVNVAWQRIMTSFTNGSFVIIAKPTDGMYPRVYGLYYGLSATAMDNNSHENGNWTTITLETPENVIGEDSIAMTVADYDALYAAAVG
nr:MAG: hypothetical protein [Bacteriophage sp.]